MKLHMANLSKGKLTDLLDVIFGSWGKYFSITTTEAHWENEILTKYSVNGEENKIHRAAKFQENLD